MSMDVISYFREFRFWILYSRLKFISFINCRMLGSQSLGLNVIQVHY